MSISAIFQGPRCLPSRRNCNGNSFESSTVTAKKKTTVDVMYTVENTHTNSSTYTIHMQMRTHTVSTCHSNVNMCTYQTLENRIAPPETESDTVPSRATQWTKD